jgi:AraC-like DNA-binding protein
LKRERINIGEVAYRGGLRQPVALSASDKMRYGVSPTKSAAPNKI